MINGKKGVMKSSTRDILLFQIMEDVANMEKENCTPKLFKDAEGKVNMSDVSAKLKKVFDINDSIDVDNEYELICQHKSKLSSMKRTVIKFLALAKKNYAEKEAADIQHTRGETPVTQMIDEHPFIPANEKIIDAEVVS